MSAEYRKVFLAFACRTGFVRLETAACVLRDCSAFHNRGWNYNILGRAGDSFVDNARNLLVGQFLETDCTDLIFVDDDMHWEPDALARLVLHPVDLVAVAYRVKTDDMIRYNLRRLDYDKETTPRWDRNPDTGLIEIDAIGTGLFRLSRAGIERMVEQRKDTWFVDRGVRGYDLFDVIRLDPHQGKEGEDYTFCRRWRAGGQKVWLDPDIRVGHIGEKRFDGCFAEELKALTTSDLNEHIRRELAGAA